MIRWKRAVRLTRRTMLFLYIAPWKDGTKREYQSVGFSLAVPYRSVWWRPTVALYFGFDDGCLTLIFEVVAYWAIRQRQGKFTTDAERAYIGNTKRYLRTINRIRYRGRRQVRARNAA